MPQQRFHRPSPRLARAFLKHFLPSDIREAVIGDFEESFGDKVVHLSSTRANIWYWSQTFKSVFSCLTGKFGEQFGIIYAYLEAAAQTLVRHKRYSLTSTIGLSLAFTCCLLIALYVAHQLSFDQYHKNTDRIFRVTTQDGVVMPAPLGPELRSGIPHIDQAARLSLSITVESSRLVHNNKFYLSNRQLYADNEIFDILDWKPVKQGEKPFLGDPFSVVLSQSLAATIFSAKDPVGGIIKINSHDYVVTGVIEDIPVNSCLRPDVIMSFSSLDSLLCYCNYPRGWLSSWAKGYSITPTYVLLDDPKYKTEVAGVISRILDEKRAAMGHEKEVGDKVQLQPLKEVYLSPTSEWQASKNGDPKRLFVMGAAVLLMLLVAGINVVNMVVTTWQVDIRPQGIRKVYRQRLRLFMNFVCEAFLITIIALTFALFTAKLLFPLFTSVLDHELSIQTGLIPWIVLCSILFALITGAIAAINPQAFLTYNNRQKRSEKVTYREYYRTRHGRLLVAFQFVIAGVLVLSASIMILQLRFLKSMPLGFDKENLLVIPFDRGAMSPEQLQELKNALLDLPDVMSVSASYAVPDACPLGEKEIHIRIPGEDESAVVISHCFTADSDFFDTYKITRMTPTADVKTAPNNLKIWLNRSAMAALGWKSPEEAVGQDLELRCIPSTCTTQHAPSVVNGIFEDYQQCYIHDVMPLAICITQEYLYWSLTLRLNAGYDERSLAAIGAKWEHLQPDIVYAPYFLAHRLTEMNEEECCMAQQLLPLAIIVLLIAYVGLFELASYTIYQKKHEISSWLGKGRSGVEVVARLSGGFIVMIVVAIVLAWPISLIATTRWLDKFAVHIKPGLGLVLLLGSGMVALGFFAVIISSVRFVLSSKRYSRKPSEIVYGR